MLDINKIHEICLGIDGHLRELESFIGVLREIKSSLDHLAKSQESQYLYELRKMMEEVVELKGQLRKYGLPEANKYEKDLQLVREMADDVLWPVAVQPELICDSEDKARQRAAAIMDIFVCEHLKGKKFLDYGCGQGHSVPEAMKREAAVAMGYDIRADAFKADGQMTSSFSEVAKNGPYDIILLHDVLDHIIMIDPIQALVQAKSVLAPNGKIYIRNHPWSSRHGGHLYTQKNRAFLHLVMDEVELTRTGGLTFEHNIKVIRPLVTYKHWFETAGLKVKSEIAVRDAVEDYFTKPSPVQERLTKIWGDQYEMVSHMEVSFVEYVLESEHQIF